jgi:hypothetical protein
MAVTIPADGLEAILLLANKRSERAHAFLVFQGD